MSYLSFGTQGERRKATKRSRFSGVGGTVMRGELGGEDLTKRQMTPNQLATYNLQNALKNYSEIKEAERKRIKKEFVEMDGIRSMNMRYLAAAIIMYDTVELIRVPIPSNTPEEEKTEEEKKGRLQPDFGSDTFSGPKWESVLRRLSLETGLDKPSDVARHKEELLAYMTKIFLFREHEPHFKTEEEPRLVEEIPFDEQEEEQNLPVGD